MGGRVDKTAGGAVLTCIYGETDGTICHYTEITLGAIEEVVYHLITLTPASTIEDIVRNNTFIAVGGSTALVATWLALVALT